MSKRRPPKKPRQLGVTIDLGEPRALDQVVIDQHSGQVRLFSKGQEVIPKEALASLGYSRLRKHKHIVTIPTDIRRLTPHPNRAVQDFDLLLVVDTNLKTIRNQRVAITAILAATNRDSGHRDLTAVNCRILKGIEFRNPDNSHERIGWMEVLQQFTSGPSYNPSSSVAVVVDSHLSDLQKINDRSMPVYRDFLLPKGITLVYATSDTPNDSILNRLIATADRVSTDLLRLVESQDNDSDLVAAINKPFTHFRSWEPAAP